jgi:hypothetical protein
MATDSDRLVSEGHRKRAPRHELAKLRYCTSNPLSRTFERSVKGTSDATAVTSNLFGSRA